MRSLTVVLVLLVMAAACTCNKENNNQSEVDSTILVIPDTLLVFDVNTEKKTLHKYTEVPDSAFTAGRVINGLNEKYKDVQIQYIKQSSDTIFIAVPDNEMLGERMGSAGAGAWYADVVMNLTGIAGINCIHISMEERSHAVPGVYKKTDFRGYTIINDSIPAS